jgi:SNF2 family DNA or RNA helicase
MIKTSPLQKCVLRFIRSRKQFLVALGTGTGKTLISVKAAQHYLKIHPHNKVIVITPASLVTNFQKEWLKTQIAKDPRVHVLSFDAYLRHRESCHNAMLIVDEAHNLLNAEGARYKAILQCASAADKRVLMTATPYVNGPEDIQNLVALLYGHPVSSIGDAIKMLKSNAILVRRGKGMRVGFPKAKIQRIAIPMSAAFQAEYNNVLQTGLGHFNKPSTFLHGYRKAVNLLHGGEWGPKLDKMLKLIGEKKAIVFSHWLKFGIHPMSDALKRAGMSFRVFEGRMSQRQRKQIVDDFNADKFQVIILSPAGGAGLDLKGARVMIVFDPPWSFASLQQIEGRGNRRGSHLALPKSQRNIAIYEFMVVSRGKDSVPSGDELLYKIVDRKRKEQLKLLQKIRKVSVTCV